MRVLILANADSGLYKFRLELLQKLTSEGHDVVVALPDGPFVPKIKALGCRFIDTPFRRRGMNPVSELRLLLAYRKILKETEPHAVLTYTIKPNVYGGLLCRLMKIPYAANITGLGASIEKGGLLQKLSLFLYRSALKKAACVFFQNQENLDFMMRNKVVTRQKFKLLPGSGVNTDYYCPLEYPAGESIHFLFIGRVMAEKGIDQYLEAAAVMTEKYPGTVFHILGSCEEGYEPRLRELAERGTVLYHGVADDVREYHKMSHCTIHPSFWEGMSNVLLESASCGRPVIASDISGCREIVDDGVTGFLFERKNSASLISAIERFMALDALEKEKMGREGRKKIERAFDRRLVVGAYMDMLGEIGRRSTAGNMAP